MTTNHDEHPSSASCSYFMAQVSSYLENLPLKIATSESEDHHRLLFWRQRPGAVAAPKCIPWAQTALNRRQNTPAEPATWAVGCHVQYSPWHSIAEPWRQAQVAFQQLKDQAPAPGQRWWTRMVLGVHCKARLKDESPMFCGAILALPSSLWQRGGLREAISNAPALGE